MYLVMLFNIWFFIVLFGMAICTSLFHRTSAKHFDANAKKDGLEPLMIAEFTSASKPIQYAFAIAMPPKYANRMARRLHVNIEALNRYKVKADVIKARLILFFGCNLMAITTIYGIIIFIKG